MASKATVARYRRQLCQAVSMLITATTKDIVDDYALWDDAMDTMEKDLILPGNLRDFAKDLEILASRAKERAEDIEMEEKGRKTEKREASYTEFRRLHG